jgi:Arm DNA-binding domain
MASHILSQYQVVNAKSRDKPYKLADGNGLHLLVQPTGSKLWLFRYRFAAKEKMLSFGAFPDIGIAAAREKCDEARRVLAQDIDPSQKRKDDRRAAELNAQNTFGAMATEYLDRLRELRRAPRTIETNEWYLNDLCKPLANRPLAAITPPEILDFLKRIERSGRRETAKRVRSVIGSVFRLAMASGRTTTDPSYALKGALLTGQSRPVSFAQRIVLVAQ